jgi:hypothetical protein
VDDGSSCDSDIPGGMILMAYMTFFPAVCSRKLYTSFSLFNFQTSNISVLMGGGCESVFLFSRFALLHFLLSSKK